VLLWEPWQILYQPENLADFSRVAPLFDIISPNTTEVREMIAESDPEQQAKILFGCGVRCLALRLGAAGSLVGTAAQLHHIPAAPAQVVDETGAGNSYCGGFVVGYVESGGTALTAGHYGAVSATFALAQLGLARLGPDATLVAQERLREIEDNR
jgi:sugar/nucleoside kinase (ribokinase family)